ncbi:MAG: hypothetical protein J2P37_07725 [Ktedonobacteraceae bacterium]|nr:hypothetical protein [Ktedonobacteraceae bacterium]
MAKAQEAVLPDDSKKSRKKQAKREAKLMLKADIARRDIRRAEQKVEKARSNLEALRGQLHDLEMQLSQLRGEHNGEVTGYTEMGVEEEIVAPGDISDVSEDVSTVPPVEGRVDIETAGEQEPLVEAQATPSDISKEGVDWSSRDEQAWSSEVREKVVEALEEKALASGKESEGGQEDGEGRTSARRTTRRSSQRQSTQRQSTRDDS